MQGEEIFQTIPDKHDSVKEAEEKAKNKETLTHKYP